jgi:hypothetical protein
MANSPIKGRRSGLLSEPQARRSRSSRYLQAAVVVAAVCLVAPSPVSAQMVFRLSVYNQATLSTDGQTVYGVTTSADNSTLGQCGHSNYDTQTTLITPLGVHYSSNSAGFAASVSGLFDVAGDYTEVGLLQFHCSCAGNIGVGQSAETCLARSDGHAKTPAVARTDHSSVSRVYVLSSALKVSLSAEGRGLSERKR